MNVAYNYVDQWHAGDSLLCKHTSLKFVRSLQQLGVLGLLGLQIIRRAHKIVRS